MNEQRNHPSERPFIGMIGAPLQIQAAEANMAQETQDRSKTNHEIYLQNTINKWIEHRNIEHRNRKTAELE